MNYSVKNKRKYCIMPFYRYDIANIEQWLSDYAQKGWHLSRNGYAFGVAAFEEGESKKVKYRLVPSEKQNKTLRFIGKSHMNCDIQKDVSRFAAREKVADIGSFCICRTCEPDVGELKINSNEYISLINKNKKQSLLTTAALIMILILFPILYPAYITSIHIKTHNMTLALMLIVGKVFDCVYAICLSNKQQNLLITAGSLSDINTGGSRIKKLWKIAKIVLFITLAVSLIITAVSAASIIRGISPESYGGELPFLTIQEYLDSDYSVSQNAVKISDNYDASVKEWSDLLAPKCIKYEEHKKIMLSDNDELTCGQYVNYYEARNSLIAEGIVKEYYSFDSRESGFKLLEITNPEVYNVDYICAYEGELHFPVVLLRKGRIAIKAYYYQISKNHKMNFENWVRALSECIQ